MLAGIYNQENWFVSVTQIRIAGGLEVLTYEVGDARIRSAPRAPATMVVALSVSRHLISTTALPIIASSVNLYMIFDMYEKEALRIQGSQ